MTQVVGDDIKTLNDDGSVPECRLGSAIDAQALTMKWIYADTLRDKKRALVKGLVDGNPPYRQSDLDGAGRSDACNVNWRIAESYLGAALGAFYDIFSEAPTYASVKLETEDTQKSNIVTEEFHRLLSRNASFDYEMQISQYEMVLFGCGPLMFTDKFDWRFRATQCRNLLVPENAKSNPDDWEVCGIRMAYMPDKLYEFIRNEKAATDAGWDVEAVKQAIIHAHPKYTSGMMYQNWEWHQQNLKNSSYYYSAESKQIFVVHIYCKEFPKEGEVEGRITHAIVLENPGGQQGEETNDYLFKFVGRFRNWRECVHGMYYDHGGGGEHHSVTGMGVKMFSAMEFQNRLMCNMADKTFAPKVMFKPTSANDREILSIANLGEYGLIPKGFEAVQMPTNQVMQDSMAFNREVSATVASNLSQYRQNLEREKGNPITATEAQWRASEQARLGKTQLNRYYQQLDAIYAEQYHRATNPNLTDSIPGGKEAREFQRRCEKRGVKKEELAKVDSVKATRIIGQGSAFARIQALESLLAIIATLPESGRENLISDFIAAKAGQFSVRRYYPTSPDMQQDDEQRERAMNQVGGMKDGINAVIADTQNPVIFAQTFLQAGAQAIQSVQEGASPPEVLRFVELCGQAVAAHLQRIAQDPTRKQVYQVLLKQFEQLGKLTDELRGMVEKIMAQNPPQNGNGQIDPETAAKVQKMRADMEMKAAKTQEQLKMRRESHDQQMREKQQSHSQNLALRDAQTAVDIQTQSQQVAAEIERKAKESQAKARMAQEKEMVEK